MRISRSSGSSYALVKVFITVLALAGVSFGAALVWQNAQDSILGADAAVLEQKPASQAKEPQQPTAPSERVYDTEPLAGQVSFASGPEVSSVTSSSKNESSKDESSKDESSEESKPPEDAPSSSGYARELKTGSVPESPAVEYSYFDDAIFFGDSISTGIPLYMQTLVPNAAVIATQGVSTIGANTSECIDVNGTRLTMLDAAKTKGERGKVYIMLGANGLDYDETPFIDGYRTFVRSVKALYPEAAVYVQSMLPVTSGVNTRYKSPNINNTRIASLNDAIRVMAAEERVHYVDVAQCMVNGQGYLPTEASPFDGMHLTPEYYIKWFDYLRLHTINTQNTKGMTK